MHFVSLHGCGWQLRALVLWKGGFLLLHLAFIPQQSPARYQGYLLWPALTSTSDSVGAVWASVSDTAVALG